MVIRGQTFREKKIRMRTLQALRGIRAEQKKGLSKNAAVIEAIKKAQLQRFGMQGKPFLGAPEKEVMKRLDRRVLPGFGTSMKRKAIKATRKVFDRKMYYKKYGLIGELFGGKGRLGILMVKPELYTKWRLVDRFLKNLGCNVVFTKNFVFGKEDIQRLYPHTLADREKYSNFSITASYLMAAPSRVIVFEHLPVENYLQKGGKKRAVETHPQNVFNQVFKENMRAAISRKNLEELGFPKASGGQIKGLAKELDVFGFFEARIPQGYDPIISMNGIHVPDYVEVLRDARTLLNLTDLEMIKRKLK